jgi:hypothetical protein
LKKPEEQLAIINTVSIEQLQRKKREKNVVIYGDPSSSKTSGFEKSVDDKIEIENIFNAISKHDLKPISIRRLHSKSSDKPGPIIVELPDSSYRNPLLVASRQLRSTATYDKVFINPDLTEAERSLDFKLRTERNRLNATLTPESLFRYHIRSSEIVKFKIKPTA